MDERIDRVTRLIEMERVQIGHEIHDALLPLVFAASASVSSLIDAESDSKCVEVPRERLERLSSWLEDAMQTGRRLLTQIYPPELVNSVWTLAVKDTLRRLVDDTTTQIQWSFAEGIDSVGEPTALAAYRIVVEAVRNAIRHGSATEVKVTGSRENDLIRVVIRDNGSGFDPSLVPQDRFGIRAMKSRAELVGGDLSVESSPGSGATVSFSIPA